MVPYRIYFLLGISLFLVSVSSAAPGTTQNVLILNSYHHGYAWSDEEVSGILESFSAANILIDPMVEYLDCKHFPRYEHFVYEKNLLKEKMSRFPVSLVLVLDNPALDFSIKYREELFSGIPIVFMGINGYRPEMVAGIPEITGVAEYLDILGTARLAITMQPDTRSLVVLHDYTSTGLSTRQEAEQQLQSVNSTLHIRYLPPMTIEEILDTVRILSPQTVFLALSFSRDRAGKIINQPDLARLLSTASSVPVYAVHGERIGFGVIGGSVLGGRAHARLATGLALRILAGVRASDIPIVLDNPYRLVLDYAALQRYGLADRLLPPGVALINRPPGFYELHRAVINTAAGIICILILAVVVLLINIARRKNAEAALRESEAQLHRAQSIAHVGSWHYDGRLGAFRPSVEMNRMMGFPIDRPFSMQDLLAEVFEEDRPAVDAAFRSALENGLSMSLEYRTLAAGESMPRYFRTLAEPIARDNMYDVFGTTQDVTARHQAEAEREILLARLAEKNQELENIVYVTSHDLRSPIINILGFSEQLARTFREFSGLLKASTLTDELKTRILPALSDDIETSLRFIQSSGKKMDVLIAGLLRFSRSGRLELRIEPLNMNQLVESAIESLKYQIESAQAVVTVDGLPPCRGDSGQINQVFSNLLDNALKYAALDRRLVITISAILRPGRVVYCVEDNGIGIAADHQKKIWELFHRLNPRGNIQGEGLGLPLVKKIVERHGGAVWVESQEERGSKFFIELPAV